MPSILLGMLINHLYNTHVSLIAALHLHSFLFNVRAEELLVAQRLCIALYSTYLPRLCAFSMPHQNFQLHNRLHKSNPKLLSRQHTLRQPICPPPTRWRSHLPTSACRYVAHSEEREYDWDSGLRAVSETIESVGAAVGSGIMSLAQGLTSWMGDLGADIEELTLGALLGDEDDQPSSSTKDADRYTPAPLGSG